jgi:hypothetical protein
MGILRRKSEADLARAAIDRATAELAELRPEPLEVEEFEPREWTTGAPSPGSVQPTTAYEAALQLEREQLPSERYQTLREQIAWLERHLETKLSNLKHAGEQVKPAAQRNLDALEADLSALYREMWEINDGRENRNRCPRCQRECASGYEFQAHKIDCRRTIRIDP